MLALVATVVVVAAVVVAAADGAYQRYSHRWTNEPPLLPYRVPFVGHALWYGTDVFGLFRYARSYFPDGQAYSLMLFGKRVYVFTHPRDVSIVFRKSKELPFLPLIESYSGLAWGISKPGMRLISSPHPSDGMSLFQNAHLFYRDALKPGPQLDSLTLRFLHYLNQALDDFDLHGAGADSKPQSLFIWSRTLLGLSSTNAMMGPSLFTKHISPSFSSPVQFLDAAFGMDESFFFFVNKIPRVFAKKQYASRDRVLDALSRYFGDEESVEESSGMIKDREVMLKERGLETRDRAAYEFSAYIALIANAKTVTYYFLKNVYSRPQDLVLLREEIAPIFTSTSAITTLSQISHLLTQCPLLRAFYSETLRLYSAAASNRVVEEDVNVNGHTLWKGHNVMCPSYIQHHSTQYFGESPSPEVFDPARFMDSPSSPTSPSSSRPTSLDTKTMEEGKGRMGGRRRESMIRAFGGGISLCSGRHFAGNEVLSLVASVIWRYDMSFAGSGVRILLRSGKA